MKVIKVLTAGCLLVLGIIGCQGEEEFPQAPILISPQDGAVFTDQAPVFVWQSLEEATEYIIRISKDSIPDGDLLVEDTLADTTYAMPQNVFESADTGTYAWAVTCLWEDEEPCWSESPTFQIENQIEETVAERLYNTFFPMDTGYEWVYVEEEWYWDTEEEWCTDIYDICIKVKSITPLENGWFCYKLEGGTFTDVGDSIITNGDAIVLNWNLDTIPTTPPPGYYNHKEDLEIQRLGNTLTFSLWGYGEDRREIGLGVVYQFRVEGYYGPGYIDRLKYFRKGDTIWRFQ